MSDGGKPGEWLSFRISWQSRERRKFGTVHVLWTSVLSDEEALKNAAKGKSSVVEALQFFSICRTNKRSQQRNLFRTVNQRYTESWLWEIHNEISISFVCLCKFHDWNFICRNPIRKFLWMNFMLKASSFKNHKNFDSFHSQRRLFE